jgi:hypothetical protein
MLIMYVDFHTLYPLPLPLGFVVLSFLHQFLEPSIDIPDDSNLGSFVYETVYDAASTIDYSKDPIDAGVVDSPPPKKIYRHSPSPSPLKGLAAHAFRHRPLDPLAILNASGGFVWTPVQQIVGRPPSLRAAFVPSYPTRTLASLVLRCPTPFQKSFYLVKFRWFKCFGSFSSN